MKIQVSELNGEALDWAVAKCKGMEYPYKVRGRGAVRAMGYALINESGIVTSYISPKTYIEWVKKCDGHPWYDGQKIWNPSENWAQGGPIIDQEDICTVTKKFLSDPEQKWFAYIEGAPLMSSWFGSTRLIAAMRCYVATTLGDEIDIPDAFAKPNTGAEKCFS